MDLAQLIFLAMIWSLSFIFMKVLAPALGPIPTTAYRVLIAGVALMVYFRIVGFDPEWKKNWKHYLIVGVVNSAIPFVMYSFAALHIPASYSVVLNSTTPLFGVLFAALWLNEQLNINRIIGVVLGACGVGLVVKVGHVDQDAFFYPSILACLTAAICYALIGIYIKKISASVKSLGIAGGGQLMAGLVLLPLVPWSSKHTDWNWTIVGALLALALICSSLAFAIYYRLLAQVGPSKALTVTFLMPLFGMLWSFLLLHEQITWSMLVGCLMIIGGTLLVVFVKQPTGS